MSETLAGAELVLRPDAQSVLEAWRRLVVAERKQVESLPQRPRPEDFYAPVAEAFRADPRRRDDPVVDALLALVGPGDTWLDLGAGGGRYALPIAMHAREVYAVEPSQGMLAVLTSSAREQGIDNLRTFQERWPSASQAPVADVGLICQVGYDIEDIGPFLDQLEAHSKRMCVAVMFQSPPLSDFGPLWQDVHGQPRLQLPALPELMRLLFARGRRPELRWLLLEPRTYATLDALHNAGRRPLWVLPGSDADRRLRDSVEKRAIPVAGGFALNLGQRGLGIVTWQPGS